MMPIGLLSASKQWGVAIVKSGSPYSKTYPIPFTTTVICVPGIMNGNWVSGIISGYTTLNELTLWSNNSDPGIGIHFICIGR